MPPGGWNTPRRVRAQPIAMAQVRITVSSLGQQAGLLGAGRLAFLEE